MRNKRHLFKKLFYILVIIGAVISMTIIYNDSISDSAYYFLMGFMLFVFLMLVHTVVTTFINMRKLSWDEAKKTSIKFLCLFILFSVLNFSADYVFRSVRTFSIYDFSTSFGLAFGLSFLDVTFLDKEKNLSLKQRK